MVRCVRLWRGEWKKNEAQEWDFERDPDDFGYRFLMSKSESYAALDQVIRRRYCLSHQTPIVVSYRLPSWMLVPLGNKTAPTVIRNSTELAMLLNVRTWLDELAILVTMGPKCVAEFHFLCRTNFSIGATTYVFDETETIYSRAAYESLVFGERATQTERVMNALFPADALMLFHRVSLEMAYADNYLASRRSVEQPVREIIEIDDDDEHMIDPGQNSRNYGGFDGFVAPSVMWDVGMDVVNHAGNVESNIATVGGEINQATLLSGVCATNHSAPGIVTVEGGATSLSTAVSNQYGTNAANVNGITIGMGNAGVASMGLSNDMMLESEDGVVLERRCSMDQQQSKGKGLCVENEKPGGQMENNNKEEGNEGTNETHILNFTLQHQSVGEGRIRVAERASETSSEESTTEGGW